MSLSEKMHSTPGFRYCSTWMLICCFLFVAQILSACQKGDVPMSPMPTQKTDDVNESQLSRVRSMRIFFGHQSVGKNIVDGLQALATENAKYRLNIVESDTPEKIKGPVFSHFRVGSNMAPVSKIESFRDNVSISGKSVNVALFKFCYVDVGPDTDVVKLFHEYKKTLADLERQFPNITFIHVTIPVKALDGGVKGVVKKVLGKSTGEAANISRTSYNDLLRKEYLGKAPIFDLAAVESTTPDGSRIQGEKNGARYEALYPLYTDDGEHLNRDGGKRAAMALLNTLADAAERMVKE